MRHATESNASSGGVASRRGPREKFVAVLEFAAGTVLEAAAGDGVV
jgi:hypothetical protein